MMMDSTRILEFLKGKSILITGSTGFLAKIFVEKLLRVQPEVKRLFLLIRAADAISAAQQRLQNEILDKDLFRILKEKHGDGFPAFAASKLCPVAGDITYPNLGIQDPDLQEKLCNEVEIVVNVAATTNFYDRYDVALSINVLGAKRVLEFARRCAKLEMLLHVSTAYVVGEQSGLILEKRFGMGETLRGGSDHYLDIEAEIELAETRKMELQADPNVTEAAQRQAMKELGLKRAKLFGWPNTYVFTKAMGEMVLGHLRPAELPLVILRPTIILSTLREPLPGWIEGTRTVDSLIIGYAKGKLSCLFGDLDLISDVIPGDMVVNAMAAAMAAHAGEGGEFIYHVGSSVRNPVAFSLIEQCGFRYFLENPRVTKSGKTRKTKRMPVFKNMFFFRAFMALRFKLPLELMHLVSLLSGGAIFASEYKKLNRIYKFGMHLVDLYQPYVFFKGRFDDKNLEGLRRSMAPRVDCEVNMFDFDPKHVDWELYFSTIHIPGVMKYSCK
ncbi:probable fatty acyl-CoA reductase 4 isoform X2 [Zingiber officinale]|uniref:probable fatty acyl-CoA reductase 4 isoform X2 n=1 Tax=Zingiber officinale TaxID=94328 RepID=UPI001C4ACB8B|nr:probable fatty acyl-CoA reductase 4 isoform X2 [Zingiber officinale]